MNRNHSKKVVSVAALLLLLTLASISTTLAAPPTRIVIEDTHVDLAPIWGECDILHQIEIELLVREQDDTTNIVGYIKETFTNLATNKSVTASVHGYQTETATADTYVIRGQGLDTLVVLPGEGPVVHEAGQFTIVIAQATGEVLSAEFHGHYPDVEWDVCGWTS